MAADPVSLGYVVAESANIAGQTVATVLTNQTLVTAGVGAGAYHLVQKKRGE